MFRRSALFAVAVAIAAFAASGAHAGGEFQDGVIVSVAAGKLVIANNLGEHNFDVGLTTRITLNGKKAKLAKLRPGDLARVAQDFEGHVVAIVAVRGPSEGLPEVSFLDSGRSVWHPTDHLAPTAGRD